LVILKRQAEASLLLHGVPQRIALSCELHRLVCRMGGRVSQGYVEVVHGRSGSGGSNEMVLSVV
jgi:hypothetical protein